MSEGNFEIQKSHIKPEKSQGNERKKIEDELAETIREMYEQLRENGENLRGIIPQDRNFDVKLQESEAGINLRLKRKESGAEKDLNAFLPAEHFFGKDEEFIYRNKEKKIGFPENELELRGFLLSLFHEIGHSHKKREHSTSRWDDLRALSRLLTKWVKYMAISIKKEFKQKGSGKKFIKAVHEVDVDFLLPQWYIDKKSTSEAQSERDAWTYALRSLRKLKQEGYDVFAGFENAAQIRAYVGHCLYTYDVNLLMKKITSGDLKGFQKLVEQPIFLRKYKMYTSKRNN